jgi:uncharacterized membrane protein YphA (DoxX/SURF4 family)
MGSILSYILCFSLVAVITVTMFWFNSTTDWDFNSQKDQVLVVVTNISAIFLCMVLVYTAIAKEELPE